MTYYFYDLETSGINSRSSRIMQFAGQRTDIDLKPIGEPDNILVKLSPDILPDPDAILITGITPQQVNSEGGTEADFCRYFADHVATPGTTMVGFNNISFDDEFMRFLLWRNFYDPYEWHWRDDRSRWDLLDVVRLTRALRPDGINWPFTSDSKPSNKLELLATVNNLTHDSAHDALSDVEATLAIARLISLKQPKLFDYLLSMRHKKNVSDLVNQNRPFIYACGRYDSDFEKTSVVVKVADHPVLKDAALVYDLRVDPSEFINMTPAELAVRWEYTKEETAPQRLPVSKIQFNKCPAVAPMGVLDDASAERLKIDKAIIVGNLKKLKSAADFAEKLVAALDIIEPKIQPGLIVDELTVDEQLYEGFISAEDKPKMSVVRAAGADELAGLKLDFSDDRLTKLLPIYKARNFPKSLSDDESAWWEEFKTRRLVSGGQSSRAAKYFARLAELAKRPNLSKQDEYLLEELNLYGQSVVPID